jgi:Flp pilus assembly pilin Flp
MIVYLKKLFASLITEEKGQGISEYASVLSLVAVVIALVYGSSSCHKFVLSQSFSSAVRKVNMMNSLSRRHSSQLVLPAYKKVC